MDHTEEQELEAEALTAIFDTSFEIISTSPNKWSLELFPIDTEGEDESNEVNHVGCNLIVDLPADYPEVLPELDVSIIRGLGAEHKEALLSLAKEEAEQYTGMPAIYSVCEAMREWLVSNNVKGLDDQSMHAQMTRRAREEEVRKVSFAVYIVSLFSMLYLQSVADGDECYSKSCLTYMWNHQEQAQQKFESQQVTEEMSQAEAEEIAVRKLRAEGTPCNKENFHAWKEKFDKEMEERENAEDDAPDKVTSSKEDIKKKLEEEVIEARLTGHQQFTQKHCLTKKWQWNPKNRKQCAW